MHMWSDARTVACVRVHAFSHTGTNVHRFQANTRIEFVTPAARRRGRQDASAVGTEDIGIYSRDGVIARFAQIAYWRRTATLGDGRA